MRFLDEIILDAVHAVGREPRVVPGAGALHHLARLAAQRAAARRHAREQQMGERAHVHRFGRIDIVPEIAEIIAGHPRLVGDRNRHRHRRRGGAGGIRHARRHDVIGARGGRRGIDAVGRHRPAIRFPHRPGAARVGRAGDGAAEMASRLGGQREGRGPDLHRHRGGGARRGSRRGRRARRRRGRGHRRDDAAIAPAAATGGKEQHRDEQAGRAGHGRAYAGPPPGRATRARPGATGRRRNKAKRR